MISTILCDILHIVKIKANPRLSKSSSSTVQGAGKKCTMYNPDFFTLEINGDVLCLKLWDAIFPAVSGYKTRSSELLGEHY